MISESEDENCDNTDETQITENSTAKAEEEPTKNEEPGNDDEDKDAQKHATMDSSVDKPS